MTASPSASPESGPASGEDGAVESRRVAAIDIGSNSTRLLVAELRSDGTYDLLDDEKAVTRLASGMDATQRLDETRMRDTVTAIGRMRAIAEGYGVEVLRAVATAAVREASNREAFLELVRREAGVDVRVIDGPEEARLAWLSVRSAFDVAARDVAVVDIGGGSTEIVIASRGIIGQVVSMPLGAVRLTEAVADASGPGRSLERLQEMVRAGLEERLEGPVATPELVIGTGGTFTTIAAVDRLRREPHALDEDAKLSVRGHLMHRADVRRMLENLDAMTTKQRTAVPGLSDDRAEIIVAGLAIVDEIMYRLGINELMVHDRGVRDGLLLGMMDELFPDRRPAAATPAPDRIEVARQFARRCNRDVGHSEQVERLSLRLFDLLSERLASERGVEALGDPEARELLQAAAILHDIGYYISYSRHHKHSYHLIMHSDLPGFTHRELELVANVARYHRRAMPKTKHAGYRRLDARRRRRVRELAAVLRIAVGLDRAHAANVRDVAVEEEDGVLRVVAVAPERPDADLWGAEAKADLFRRTFEREIVFDWRRGDPAD